MPNQIEESSLDPIAKHRRDLWLQIILPVMIPAGVIILTLVVLFTLAVAGTLTPEQVNTVSNILLTVCILFPLALLAILLNAAFIAMAWGTGLISPTVTPVIRQVRQGVQRVTNWAPHLADLSMRPLIAINARWTRWERFVTLALGMRRAKTELGDKVENTSEAQYNIRHENAENTR